MVGGAVLASPGTRQRAGTCTARPAQHRPGHGADRADEPAAHLRRRHHHPLGRPDDRRRAARTPIASGLGEEAGRLRRCHGRRCCLRHRPSRRPGRRWFGAPAWSGGGVVHRGVRAGADRDTSGSRVRGFAIAPTATGSTLAWIDPGTKNAPGAVVVYDTAEMTELIRLGNADAVPLAVYDDVVYWSPDGRSCGPYLCGSVRTGASGPRG